MKLINRVADSKRESISSKESQVRHDNSDRSGSGGWGDGDGETGGLCLPLAVTCFSTSIHTYNNIDRASRADCETDRQQILSSIDAAEKSSAAVQDWPVYFSRAALLVASRLRLWLLSTKPLRKS